MRVFPKRLLFEGTGEEKARAGGKQESAAATNGLRRVGSKVSRTVLQDLAGSL